MRVGIIAEHDCEEFCLGVAGTAAIDVDRGIIAAHAVPTVGLPVCIDFASNVTNTKVDIELSLAFKRSFTFQTGGIYLHRDSHRTAELSTGNDKGTEVVVEVLTDSVGLVAGNFHTTLQS